MTRSEKLAARKAAQKRIDKAQSEARAIVVTGHCPDCGEQVAGRFEKFGGQFGRRRITVRLSAGVA